MKDKPVEKLGVTAPILRERKTPTMSSVVDSLFEQRLREVLGGSGLGPEDYRLFNFASGVICVETHGDDTNSRGRKIQHVRFDVYADRTRWRERGEGESLKQLTPGFKVINISTGDLEFALECAMERLEPIPPRWYASPRELYEKEDFH